MASHLAATALLTSAPVDLCLSFANTLGWRGREKPTERLGDAPDLAAWLAAHSRIVPAPSIHVDQEVHAQALTLREAIYRVFSSLAAGREPPSADVSVLNDALAAAPSRRGVARWENTFAWQVDYGEHAGAAALLSPVLWSAADLLVSGRLDRVRQCANPECLWLFLDDSRSGARRWCDMASCGNRAKARRHYLRHKKV